MHRGCSRAPFEMEDAFSGVPALAELLRTTIFNGQIQIRQIQLIVGIMGLDDPGPAILGLSFKTYDEP